MSKQLRPVDLGENRSEPVRSLLVLRAWAAWRARDCGWTKRSGENAMYVDRLESAIATDVSALGSSDGVLGHPVATAMFEECLPDVTRRLRAHLVQSHACP